MKSEELTEADIEAWARNCPPPPQSWYESPEEDLFSMKRTKVYIYEDSDHGDLVVFTTLKAARAYAEEKADIYRWDEDGNPTVGDEEDECVHDYIRVHEKEVRAK